MTGPPLEGRMSDLLPTYCGCSCIEQDVAGFWTWLEDWYDVCLQFAVDWQMVLLGLTSYQLMCNFWIKTALETLRLMLSAD